MATVVDDQQVGADSPGESGPDAAHDEPGARGGLEVRQRVLTRIAEHTATLVPGAVQHSSGLGRLAGRGYPSATATVAGQTSRIELDIAAVWPCNVNALSRTVRDRVRSETSRLSGTRVNSVDVTVHLVDATGVSNVRRVE
ncbi:Asp23/Gls24 family envelope stress response protein [Demetria terragena]|uniref:Asp23/Gls24 family envelope stress response protein n=1 Tax=Demetria terragena TaxID=63959 RepID=UPI00036CF6A2|nr:Asp23/Gls24 family envelope stress response protein [Demetria terragena]